MDTTAFTSGILGICSILLGINAFFLRSLVVEFRVIANLAVKTSQQLVDMEKRLDKAEDNVAGISSMREDIAVLREKITAALDWIKVPRRKT